MRSGTFAGATNPPYYFATFYMRTHMCFNPYHVHINRFVTIPMINHYTITSARSNTSQLNSPITSCDTIKIAAKNPTIMRNGFINLPCSSK